MIHLIDKVNDIFWGYFLIAGLILCALWFTLRTKGVQFTMIGEMFRLLGESADKPAEKTSSAIEKASASVEKASPKEKKTRFRLKAVGPKGHISSFQAFAVSLATRVGTGNLAGVACAIAVGGPGAVFWMWVTALLGSATAFVESTLAQLFKIRGKDSFVGGPAYYMERGLGKRWMGVVFAVLITLTFGLSYNSVQSNTLCAALDSAFGWNRLVVGLIVCAVMLVIIFGGIRRIAHFSSAIVPIMAIGYITLAFVVVAINIHSLPHVLKMIFEGAFGLRQAAGGLVGSAIMQGVKRGLFSNEAGEGSAPNAAATAHTSHPVKQGLIQALGVFTDTLVICSCTAFIILCSGDTLNPDVEGVQLTQHALSTQFGSFGVYFVAIALLFFVFSSLIGNYYYGEANLHFMLKGHKSERLLLNIFRCCSAGMVLFGALASLTTVWAIADLFMALMTTFNLLSIVLLGHYAFRLLDDYRSQKKKGNKSPVFRKRELFPEISDKLEGWE